MAELTKEQVEQAAIQLWAVTYGNRAQPKADRWDDIDEAYKEEWRQWARIAAEYVQRPWDEPTLDEFMHLVGGVSPYSKYGEIIMQALKDFVKTRNAALLPKPVDPRREAVINVLESRDKLGLNFESVADDILAALDEVK